MREGPMTMTVFTVEIRPRGQSTRLATPREQMLRGLALVAASHEA